MDTPPGAPVDASGCTLPAEIRLPLLTFAFASDELQSEGRTALDEIAAWLRRNPDLEIEIGGYADSTGSDAFNLELSRRRAANVRRHLVERGVTNTLNVRAYGESAPATDNTTPTGRARNRRVVVRIVSP